jgi:YVTN family beta-propeller protein
MNRRVAHQYLPVMALLAALLWCNACARGRREANGPVATVRNGSPLDLSPVAVVVSADGNTLYLACSTAHQVVFFDVRSQATERRLELPGPPSGLALAENGQRLYVTCASPESTVCVVATHTGKILARIPTGHTACSPVLSPDQKTLYVCNRFDDAIAVIDLETQRERSHIRVGREPVAATLSKDGRWLFVANHLHRGRADVGVVAGSVSVVDTAAGGLAREIPLPNGSTLQRGICTSPDGRYVAVAHNLARFHLPTTHATLGWMNNSALTLIDVEEQKAINTVLLDDLVQGAANPWAVAWSADGRHLCVTHAGTHEVSVIHAPALLAKLARLPLPEAEAKPRSSYFAPARVPADVPNDLRFLAGLRTRIKLPGYGPRALALYGSRAYVACYFSDSVCSFDIKVRESPPVSSVGLFPSAELSAVRKGELYFNDATWCIEGWQSCASCHSSDARTDGLDWDLANDGIGNPKNVKSLLLAFESPPVMSMGVRADAAAAIRAGIQYILFTNGPPDRAAAIDEYVKSLKPVPSPRLRNGRLSVAAERGKEIFFNNAIGCAGCHRPPWFTDLKPHAVGTGKFDTESDRFYTPSLVEVWRTGPYLHDGSAPTLREAITTHNPHNARGRTAELSPKQIADLVAYVESL